MTPEDQYGHGTNLTACIERMAPETRQALREYWAPPDGQVSIVTVDGGDEDRNGECGHGTSFPSFYAQPDRISQALAELKANLVRRDSKHGPSGHASIHETLGVLVEEMDEFKTEVKANLPSLQYAELCDIATAAIVGMASIRGM